MTKPDEMTQSAASRPLLGQILFYVGFCLALGVLGVGLLGFTKGGLDLTAVGILGGLFLLGAALVWYAIRVGDFDPPGLATNTGKSQLIMLVSCILGGVIGVYLVATGTIDRFMGGDFTISTGEAIAGLVILLAMAVPMSLIRERTADDYERAAAREAAYWSLSFYFIAYLSWKISELGELLPPVHDFSLFLLVTFLFLGIWIFKRSG